MPILTPEEWEQREERARQVAAMVVAYTDGLLWAEEPHAYSGRGRLHWYARRRTDEPWRTGHAAANIRDHLFSLVRRDHLSESPYARWPEAWRLASPQGLRRYFPILLSIWSERERPEDLPS